MGPASVLATPTSASMAMDRLNRHTSATKELNTGPKRFLAKSDIDATSGFFACRRAASRPNTCQKGYQSMSGHVASTPAHVSCLTALWLLNPICFCPLYPICLLTPLSLLLCLLTCILWLCSWFAMLSGTHHDQVLCHLARQTKSRDKA